MQLSKQSLEMLTDLVENKLSCMEIWDREDRREVAILQRCLRELQGIAGEGVPKGAVAAAFAGEGRRRGRRPKIQQLAH
jgi:hypothetical protein